MTVTTYRSSEQQAFAALAIGQRRRAAQGRLCREIRALEPSQSAHLAADALLNVNDDNAQALLVKRLLLSVRGVGPQTCEWMLGRVGVVRRANTIRLRDLTWRQRHELMTLLLGHVGERAA